MIESHELLVALQHGDSFFPSGGTSFSWGLEPLYRDGRLRDEGALAGFIRCQLKGRWAPFDRPILLAAHAGAIDDWRFLDSLIERRTPSVAFRQGSRRAGAAMLAIHQELETPGAATLYNLVRAGETPGHLTVVQGLVWKGIGLSPASATFVSAHGLVTAILSAALRLGLTGHRRVQFLRSVLNEEIASLIAKRPPGIEEISSFEPLAEIASMRRSRQDTWLFAT